MENIVLNLKGFSFEQLVQTQLLHVLQPHVVTVLFSPVWGTKNCFLLFLCKRSCTQIKKTLIGTQPVNVLIWNLDTSQHCASPPGFLHDEMNWTRPAGGRPAQWSTTVETHRHMSGNRNKTHVDAKITSSSASGLWKCDLVVENCAMKHLLLLVQLSCSLSSQVTSTHLWGWGHQGTNSQREIHKQLVRTNFHVNSVAAIQK